MTSMLQIKKLSKSFGDQVIARSISLELKEGSISILYGPNGTGKTTLFNLISGVETEYDGKIFIAGKDLSKYRRWERARMGLGRTFQNIRLPSCMPVLNLLNLAIKDNSTLDFLKAWSSQKRNDSEFQELLTELNLTKLLAKKVSDLSTGEKRKVSVACALLRNPSLLLLDEPASGLDDSAKNNLVSVLKTRASRGLTILAIEHDQKFIENCADNVFLLYSGDLTKHSSLEDLKEHYIGL